MSRVGTFTPPGTPQPMGPYSHISKVGTAIGVSDLPKPGIRLTMNLTAITRE